jgi:hypothetical protein
MAIRERSHRTMSRAGIIRAPGALALGALLLTAIPLAAQPGVTSAVRTVSMSAIKTTAITVSVVSGGTQTLANITDNAINTFATPVQISTSWTLHPSTGNLRLIAYFSTAAQALANGTEYIGSVAMEGRIQTLPTTPWQPTAWTPFTQNASDGVGTNGASLRLMDLNINGANRQASRTMDLELRLNLTGQPTTSAGTYSGTITLRAVTT